MNSRWFREDRKLPKGEQAEAKKKTEEALKNSTLMLRLLKGILNEEIESTYADEEDFSNPAYERVVIAAASKRKALKDIMKLLP